MNEQIKREEVLFVYLAMSLSSILYIENYCDLASEELCNGLAFDSLSSFSFFYFHFLFFLHETIWLIKEL